MKMQTRQLSKWQEQLREKVQMNWHFQIYVSKSFSVFIGAIPDSSSMLRVGSRDLTDFEDMLQQMTYM